MLTFCNLFSGSTGNATYIGTERDAVLVDCGMSYKQILLALQCAKLDPSLIRAILVTHEHSDHIRGVDVCARKLNIPVLATPLCQEAMNQTLQKLPMLQRICLEPGESCFFGTLEAASFSIPHDAVSPVGYRIFSRDGSASCATDLGWFSPTVESAITGSDIVLLESNHDPQMLQHNPNYSDSLKKRILSRRGHLSNNQCSEAALKLISAGTKHFLLGHLSRENNLPSKAKETTSFALCEEGLCEGKEFTLEVASPTGPVKVYEIGT